MNKEKIYKYGYIGVWLLASYQFWNGYGAYEMLIALSVIIMLIILDNAFSRIEDTGDL